jgi:hypothetical protein
MVQAWRKRRFVICSLPVKGIAMLTCDIRNMNEHNMPSSYGQMRKFVDTMGHDGNRRRSSRAKALLLDGPKCFTGLPEEPTRPQAWPRIDFTSLPAHVKHPIDVPTFVNDARSMGLTQIECLVMNKKRRSHDAFVARNRPNFNKAARRFSIRVVVGSLPQLRAAM